MMAVKKRTPERQRTIDDVRAAIFAQPEMYTEEIMNHTAEEYFKNLDIEKIIKADWRAFTRRILRVVRDDTNIPIAFNHPTKQGREYVNVEISQDLNKMELVLETLIVGRDSRNRAIDKVQHLLEEKREFFDRTKAIKEGEFVESTRQTDDEE